MRILANYGYRSNGDSYSVTFETVGDVPREQANATVDELFRLAREAVKRQVNGAPQSHHPTGVTVPRPKGEAAAAGNPNPDANGNESGNNGGKNRPAIKDPSRPATPKQVALVKRLAREKGVRLPELTDLKMGEASAEIDALRAL